MTPAQFDAARAVVEELRFMFEDCGQLLRVEEVLAGHCKHYGLPLVNGDLLAKLSAAHIAAAEAMDAYDEYLASAAGRVERGGQQGDPAPIQSMPAPSVPLKVAA